MAFQIKNFVSIVAAMVNHMRATQDKITDFNVGSVARTLVEAPAVEIDELYQQMFHGLKEAIPVAVFSSFGFPLLEAEGGSGVVRFSTDVAATEQILVPAGTTVRVSGGSYLYATQVDGIIAVGKTYVDVMVYCQSTGAATNCLSGTINELASNVSGIVSVSNPNDITNGRDIETDDQRKVRFQGYISTLPRGTVDAVAYGAKTAYLSDANGQIVEHVSAAQIIEPFLEDATIPVGLLEVYIYNGVGGTSPALVARAKQVIDGYRLVDGTKVHGWKAGGVVVNVFAAQEVSVSVTGVLEVLATYQTADVIAEARENVRVYLQELDIGQTAVRNEIIRIIKTVAGVYNFTMPSPAADVAVTNRQKVVPGTISLS